ncbi:hypothetical protein TCAL_14333 [Tigriopus californicus]|uniref:Uncharacterized protein n=1 Tax=Tigriopus californicus TaxID=6832 RepID=A0A553NFN5_TIGCA|nr:uncharacterized protein LOC131888217 [Tigriopus californicus]TRY64231.1 hypothetical protein TCAL_14333 [Tigriopus californicus]
MPGKLVLGVVAEFTREDEGEYICPMCTVFGLDDEEVQTLIKAGLKMIDRNKEDEGYEVKNSAFKLMRELGRLLGYEPIGDTQCTDAPNGRKTIVWTLTKDA